MQGRDCRIGGAAQDGHGVKRAALPVPPVLVETGKSDQLRRLRAEQERPPLSLGSGPFVEVVGWNQAAAPAHGIAERRLLQHILGSGIDQGRKFLRVVDEGRQQPPAHELKAARSLPVDTNNGNWLRRGDIVAGRKIRRVGITEIGAHRLRWRGQAIARAHALAPPVTLWQSYSGNTPCVFISYPARAYRSGWKPAPNPRPQARFDHELGLLRPHATSRQKPIAAWICGRLACVGLVCLFSSGQGPVLQLVQLGTRAEAASEGKAPWRRPSADRAEGEHGAAPAGRPTLR